MPVDFGKLLLKQKIQYQIKEEIDKLVILTESYKGDLEVYILRQLNTNFYIEWKQIGRNIVVIRTKSQ